MKTGTKNRNTGFSQDAVICNKVAINLKCFYEGKKIIPCLTK